MKEIDKKVWFVSLMGAFGIGEILAGIIFFPRPNVFALLGAVQLLAIMLYSEKTKFLRTESAEAKS